jgi:hypothetical protein
LFTDTVQWKNPRATAISFAAAVIFIFAARYLNVIRYIFKALWVTLGSTLLHLFVCTITDCKQSLALWS